MCDANSLYDYQHLIANERIYIKLPLVIPSLSMCIVKSNKLNSQIRIKYSIHRQKCQYSIPLFDRQFIKGFSRTFLYEKSAYKRYGTNNSP